MSVALFWVFNWQLTCCEDRGVIGKSGQFELRQNLNSVCDKGRLPVTMRDETGPEDQTDETPLRHDDEGGGKRQEWMMKINDRNEEVLLLAAVCFPFVLLPPFSELSSSSPQIGIVSKSRVVSGATEPHRSPWCGAVCHQRLSYCSPVTPPPPLLRARNNIT